MTEVYFHSFVKKGAKDLVFIGEEMINQAQSAALGSENSLLTLLQANSLEPDVLRKCTDNELLLLTFLWSGRKLLEFGYRKSVIQNLSTILANNQDDQRFGQGIQIPLIDALTLDIPPHNHLRLPPPIYIGLPVFKYDPDSWIYNQLSNLSKNPDLIPNPLVRMNLALRLPRLHALTITNN